MYKRQVFSYRNHKNAYLLFLAIIAHWTLINKASIIPFVKKIVGNRDYDKNSRRYERC